MSNGEDDDDNLVFIVIGASISLCFLISLVVAAVHYDRFSVILQHGHCSDYVLVKKIGDLNTCSWFFMPVPLLNIGLASGMAHHVKKLAAQVRPPLDGMAALHRG